MNIWKDINPERIKDDDFIAVIEIPKGCKKKYELDKETGRIILDRILYTSMQFPANYGFIPLTYAEDNDPLDVYVLCSESLNSLDLVRCYPIGVIVMEDCGKLDQKIIAVPFNDPVYNNYSNISDLPNHIFEEIKHFLSFYKVLENKQTAVKELEGREEAIKIIKDCKERYKKYFTK